MYMHIYIYAYIYNIYTYKYTVYRNMYSHRHLSFFRMGFSRRPEALNSTPRRCAARAPKGAMRRCCCGAVTMAAGGDALGL